MTKETFLTKVITVLKQVPPHIRRALDEDGSQDAAASDITLCGSSQPAELKKRRRSDEDGTGEDAEEEDAQSEEGDGHQSVATWSEDEGHSGSELMSSEGKSAGEDITWTDPENDVSNASVMEQAEEVHNMMRSLWKAREDKRYPAHLLRPLLFMKRRSAETAADDSAAASQPGLQNSFASQAHTVRAIQRVLKVRKRFLDSENISDMRHVLTTEEQGELIQCERRCYEMSKPQLALQMRDAAKFKGRGADLVVRQQKHKRWCRHLQRVCGTGQLWEVLAFHGRFDAELLRALRHGQAAASSR